MTETCGIILPLPEQMIKSAISEGKDIFTKFSRREIHPGYQLYIYGTGDDASSKIVATAKITEIEEMPAEDVWEEYGSRIFPEKREFDEYIRGRNSKNIVLMKLDNITLLDDPVDVQGNVTMSGLYVDNELFEEIQSEIIT